MGEARVPPSGSFRLLQARSYHAHVRRARTRTERDLSESTYEKTVLQLYSSTAPGPLYIKVYQCRQSVSSQPAVIRPCRALFLSCTVYRTLVYHRYLPLYHTTGGALPRRAATCQGTCPCEGREAIALPWGPAVGIRVRVRVRHAPLPPPPRPGASPDL